MGELLERLRSNSTSFAPAWAPAEGDGIEGVLVARHERSNEGRRGDPYPVLVIDTDDGQRLAWHAAGDIAAEQLAEHGPEIGDRIAVLFVAEQKSSRGNTFKRWAVAVDRQVPDPGPSPRAPKTPGEHPAETRALITERLNGIPDAATRHRAKKTFARVHGCAPQGLADADVDRAKQWVERAIAGREVLDEL